MLKARVGDKYVFGLSAKNVERLMDGQPILIDMRELGLESGHVMIFYGKTEADMQRALEEAGIELQEKPS